MYRYIPVIRILRTTTKLLCEMYHDRAPSKTWYATCIIICFTVLCIHAHTTRMIDLLMEKDNGNFGRL